jgi:hypothetical protein
MKKFVIFGDSYSTYEGYIPDGYAFYYCPQGRPETPVTKMRVEETWWARLSKAQNAELVLNNSWSGSTIGYTGYDNSDCSQSSSFIYRYRQLQKDGFFNKNQIDTLFVFGGTNDSWSDAPLGELKFSNWEEKDLFRVLPAICYFAYLLKNNLPDSEIVFIINTEIKVEIQTAIMQAAEYYGVKSISLENIDKKNGHPTKLGMSQIAEQVIKGLKQ